MSAPSLHIESTVSIYDTDFMCEYIILEQSIMGGGENRPISIYTS